MSYESECNEKSAVVPCEFSNFWLASPKTGKPGNRDRHVIVCDGLVKLHIIDTVLIHGKLVLAKLS